VTATIIGADGRPAAAGNPGEIHVAGDILMDGYLAGDGLDTSRLGAFGFATGDLGTLDAAGGLSLLGRSDDILNIGGKKLVPDEVEAALVAADEGIAAAACTGLPDPVLGEAVHAHLVLAPGTDAAALVERLPALLAPRLESWKQPVRYSIVDALPMTASGKLQRARLKRG
jgi:fatty-acyl-CoA synthase